MRTISSWIFIITSFLLVTVANAALAQSQTDHNHGASTTSTLTTIWFQPANSGTSWVDIHYTHNGADQQNLRMSYNAASNRYETKVGPVARGDQIEYWFTYNKAKSAHESRHSSYIVGNDSTKALTNSASWSGKTTFELVNNTGGKWADSQVYWAIIGRDPQYPDKTVFVHVEDDGTLTPMALTDNGALNKGGVGYSNYFRPLSQTRSIEVPTLDSARLLVSLGSPMYIKVELDANGNIGYAGANIENANDPNIDVYFDFAEMAILAPGSSNPGIFVNTTRVDHFGFPLTLRVEGENDATVGEPLGTSRDAIFNAFRSDLPSEFVGLAQAPYEPYRIVAPAHASFGDGQAHANYLQSYIDSVWEQFRNQDLVFTLPTLGQFRGRVNGDTFVFTGGNNNGTYYINGKPSTREVLLGNGLLNDPAGTSDGATQLQIQAQLCAALNRHVAATPEQWYQQQSHYPSGQAANWYAKFWHDHAISGLAYGFAYDDVGDFSPSIHDTAPTKVTLTVGW